MRPITRSSIDELAKRMPVIDQKEQRKYVGSDAAFNYSGTWLGETNYGNSIKVLDNSEFNAFWVQFQLWGTTQSAYGQMGNPPTMSGVAPSSLDASGSPVIKGIMETMFLWKSITFNNGATFTIHAVEQNPMLSGFSFLKDTSPYSCGSFALYYPIEGHGTVDDTVDGLRNAVKSLNP